MRYLWLPTLITSFCFLMAGCRSTHQIKPFKPTPSFEGVRLTTSFVGQPHQSRQFRSFLIGEPIELDLELKNYQSVPIEIHGVVFSNQKLLFSSPNQVHLFGPDGKDYLESYQCSDCYHSHEQPILAESDERSGRRFMLSNHLYLQQPGQYTFWMELVDNHGEKHRSNELHFQLEAGKFNAPPELIELELLPKSQTFALTDTWDVDVLFTNLTEQPLTFLKPQEGSLLGWINPIYQFTALDESSRQMVMLPHAERPYPPVYNKKTQFTLAPQETFTQTLPMPPVLSAGIYQVQLTYIVRDYHLALGAVTTRRSNWDLDVFVGVIESNQITVTIE